MHMANLNDVIGRAAVDADFRNALLADPEGTNTKENLGLTAEELNSIRQLDATAIEAALNGGQDLSAQ